MDSGEKAGVDFESNSVCFGLRIKSDGLLIFITRLADGVIIQNGRVNDKDLSCEGGLDESDPEGVQELQGRGGELRPELGVA